MKYKKSYLPLILISVLFGSIVRQWFVNRSIENEIKVISEKTRLKHLAVDSVERSINRRIKILNSIDTIYIKPHWWQPISGPAQSSHQP